MQLSTINPIICTNLMQGYTTTPTAGAITYLTSASTRSQFFTGTTSQTVEMPPAGSVTNGYEYEIVNRSTGTLTVRSSALVTIVTVLPNSKMSLVCIDTSGVGGIGGWVSYLLSGPLVGDTNGPFSSNIVTRLQGNIPVAYAGSSGGYAIGFLSSITGNVPAVSLGISCESSGGVAIGNVNTAEGSIAIGGSNHGRNGGVTLGYSNQTGVGGYSVAIGLSNNTGNASTSVAFGYGNNINVTNASTNGIVCIGYNNNISGNGYASILMGQGSTSTGTNGVVLGVSNFVGATNGMAIGAINSVTGTNGIAIGRNLSVTANNAVLIGTALTNSVADTVAFAPAGEVFRTLAPSVGNHSYKLYKHTSGDSATITNVTGSGTIVTYTAINTFVAGQTVTITGTVTSTGIGTPGQYNLTSVIIATATQTQFTVANSATGTYLSGGSATTVPASVITLTAPLALGGYFDATFAGAIAITMDTGANLDASAQLASNLYIGMSFTCIVVASDNLGQINILGATGVTLKGTTTSLKTAKLLFYRTNVASWDVVIA